MITFFIVDHYHTVSTTMMINENNFNRLNYSPGMLPMYIRGRMAMLRW